MKLGLCFNSSLGFKYKGEVVLLTIVVLQWFLCLLNLFFSTLCREKPFYRLICQEKNEECLNESLYSLLKNNPQHNTPFLSMKSGQMHNNDGKTIIWTLKTVLADVFITFPDLII